MNAYEVGLGAGILIIVFCAGFLVRCLIQPARRPAVRADRPKVGRYGEERAAWRRVATLLGRGAPGPALYSAVAEGAGWLLGADGAGMLRYESDGTTAVLASWERPAATVPADTRVSDVLRDLGALVPGGDHAVRMDTRVEAPGPVAATLRRYGVRSAVGAPITVKGNPWGAVIAFSTHDVLPPGVESRAADFTDLAATAVAATADLAASRARIIAAADQIRRKIERDLHDGAQQRLISLALNVRMAEVAVPAELADARAQLSAVAHSLVDIVDHLREVSRSIYPAILSEGGLMPAVKTLARNCTVSVDLDVRVGTRFPQLTEVTAYCVVAEALANAVQHAEASVIRVAVDLDAKLHVSVHDDGVGGADPARGAGLIGLIDRVDALGGTVTIASPPGQGTSLHVELPVEPD